jgi:tetratricopeptide (TPR) repeat protein
MQFAINTVFRVPNNTDKEAAYPDDVPHRNQVLIGGLSNRRAVRSAAGPGVQVFQSARNGTRIASRKPRAACLPVLMLTREPGFLNRWAGRPHSHRRTSRQQSPHFVWKLLFAVLLAGLLAGCGSSKPSPQVEEAKRLLQRDQPQEALDLLEAEQSAEGRYVKAVSLSRLKMRDAAREQVAAALEQKPKNLKYRGLDLKLRLEQGGSNEEAELIELHAEHPSSSAIAYYAYSALETQAARHAQQQRRDESERSRRAALAALQSAITLSADVPELQREMLEFAMKHGLTDGVQRLIASLQKVSPDDPELVKNHVAALLFADQPQAALEVARTFYRNSNFNDVSAVIYATALSQAEAGSESDRQFEELTKRHRFNADVTSRYAVYLTRSQRFEQAVQELKRGIDTQPNEEAREMLNRLAAALPGRYASVLVTEPASPQRDREFQTLMAQNPEHPGIVTGYALYLTRSNRFNEAIGILEEAIERISSPQSRLTLIRVAIDLPLEVGAEKFASRQLERFRDQIADKLLITYFEGRLLFLRKDYQGALDKMGEVVEAQKTGRGGSRALAAEALVWMDRILADRAIYTEMEKTREVIQGQAQSADQD